MPNDTLGFHMDNFDVDVTARHAWALEHVVKLLMAENSTIRGYQQISTPNGLPRLLMHWAIPESSIPGKSTVTKFPYDLKMPQVVPFISGWLENQSYGVEPDFDGHCSKGWRIHNHIHTQGFCDWDMVAFAIEPAWAIHHK